MSKYEVQLEMLEAVASALDPQHLQEMVFIGGCTTGLLLDQSHKGLMTRYTLDVDLIVDIASTTDWYELEQRLRKLSFVNDIDSGINCRYLLKGDPDRKVDFMPTDVKILGFENIWFPEAVKNKIQFTLPNTLTINLLKTPYFLATKFEAYAGRGNNDPILSHDIEDIMTVCMGRGDLVNEIYHSPDPLREFLANSFEMLTNHADYSYILDIHCTSSAIKEYVKSVIKAIINKWSSAF